MTDEYVWTFCYLVRIDPNDFGYTTVENPYTGPVAEGEVVMSAPEFFLYMGW